MKNLSTQVWGLLGNPQGVRLALTQGYSPRNLSPIRVKESPNKQPVILTDAENIKDMYERKPAGVVVDSAKPFHRPISVRSPATKNEYCVIYS